MSTPVHDVAGGRVGTSAAGSSPADEVAAAGSGRANSRAALVSAALVEFTEKGYEAANVADIADRAGVTTGALYAHFRGKLDLLLATLGLRPVGDFVGNSGPSTGQRSSARMATTWAREMAASPSRETLLLLDVIVLARRDPKLAATIRRLLGLKIDELVTATDQVRDAGVFDSTLGSADLARVLVLIAFGKMVLAAIDEASPSAAAFARITESLLRPGGAGGGGSSLDVVADRSRTSRQARLDLEAAVREAVSAGHSLRQVGEAAGISHEQIRRIVAGWPR